MSRDTVSDILPSTIDPTQWEALDYFGHVGEGDEREHYGMEEALLQYGKNGVDRHVGLFSCDSCGAHYNNGVLFHHVTDDRTISIGWQCADKMGMTFNLAEANSLKDGAKSVGILKLANRLAWADRMAWGRANRNLLRAVTRGQHYIAKDIRVRLAKGSRFYAPSEAQATLVLKLYAQQNEPEEPKVSAPIADKRQTVEGEIVSVRWKDSDYGGAFKMTVKITTPDGVWITWGTLPTKLEEEAYTEKQRREDFETATVDILKGCTVRFDAKLQAGNDEHFCFFKRPTKTSILKFAVGAQ